LTPSRVDGELVDEGRDPALGLSGELAKLASRGRTELDAVVGHRAISATCLQPLRIGLRREPA
jgi:hypothetical protein